MTKLTTNDIHATRARELCTIGEHDGFACLFIGGLPMYHAGTVEQIGHQMDRLLPLIAAALTRAAEEAVTDMTQRKDAAYLERNLVVAALAKCFPSGIARTAIEGWSDDWHGCVYIDLPTGQVSWHYHDSQAHLFAGLPPYTKLWDGHSTEEKYRRGSQRQAAQPVGSEDKPTKAGPWLWRASKTSPVRAMNLSRDQHDELVYEFAGRSGPRTERADYLGGEWAKVTMPSEA